MNAWHGHQLITRATLEELQLRGDGNVRMGATPAERILVVASEFWAAAATHRLAEYLQPATVSKMQAAEWAFTELWAFRAASSVYRGLEALLDRPTADTVHSVVAALEAELEPLADDIDQMLAAFATELAIVHRPLTVGEARGDSLTFY
jgi:hypothetical protein